MHPNKRHSFGLLSSIAALALLAFAPHAANAATTTPKFASNTYIQGIADGTSTTFATTSYADLTGASVTVYPVEDPNTTDAASGTHTDYLRVSVTLNMSKATGTSGTCAVYANGAIVAKTAQVQNFLAGVNQNVSAVWYLPNTTSASQTVKVQCKSADTSILTVSASHLIVEELN